MLSPETFDLTFLPQISFEIAIFVLLFIVWIIFLRRWISRKARVAQLLLYYLSTYLLATAFTVFIQFNKRILIDELFNATFFEDMYKILIFLANLFYFYFYQEVFGEIKIEKQNKRFYIFTIICLATGILGLFVNLKEYFILDVLLVIHSLWLFVPTAVQSRRTFKLIGSDDPHRWGFYFLFLMSVFFISVWIANVANVVWDLFTSKIYGPFWFLSWLLIGISIINTYLGFAMPAWLKNRLNIHE